MLGIRAERTRRGWHVNVFSVRELWDRRQHADDCVQPVVHLVFRADDLGVTAFVLLPVAVAEDEHWWRAGIVVGRQEVPSQQRLDAKQIEKACRDHPRVHAVRLAPQQNEIKDMDHASCDDERHALGRHPDRDEQVDPKRQVEHHRRGRQPPGERLRVRPTTDQAEQRGVGANAERERENCNQRESGTLAQYADTVTDIVCQGVHLPSPHHVNNCWHHGERSTIRRIEQMKPRKLPVFGHSEVESRPVLRNRFAASSV